MTNHRAVAISHQV